MEKNTKLSLWYPHCISVLLGILLVCLIATGTIANVESVVNARADGGRTLIAGVTPRSKGLNTFDRAPRRAKDIHVSLGLGVGTVPDYEGSEDYRAIPMLFGRVGWNTGRYVALTGLGLKANILAHDMWSFGPLVRYRLGRDEDVDNAGVALMREVDESVEVGAFVGVKRGNWHAGLQAGQDVADGHDGLLARFDAGYKVRFGKKLMVGITVFTTYADDDYMDAYFAVDADNASRSGLNIYDADSGFKDVGGMLTLGCTPWGKWGVMGMVGYTRLIGDAKNSPVVDVAGDANQYRGGVMATCRF